MAAYQPRHYQSAKPPRYRGSAKKAGPVSGSPLLHMLYLPLTLLYLELALFFCVTPGFNVTLWYLPLFSLSVGGLLWLLCSLGSEKLNHILTAVFSGILTLYFIVQYFIFRYFLMYMPLGTITGGAADVAGTFMADIITLVTKGIPVILLMLVPFVLYLIFGRRYAPAKKASAPLRIIAAVLVVVLLAVGVLSVRLSYVNKEKYWEEYEFNTAAQTFGLITATRLDLETRLFKAEPGFVPVDPDQPDDPDNPDKPDNPDNPDNPDKPDKPVVYGDNALNIDFESLIAGESNKVIKQLHEFVASRTATKKNQYTGMFKDKNLIFITAEAFAAEVIDPVLTPTLYRLANKGIQFKEYYQPHTGASTLGGEFTNLMGMMPTNSTKSFVKMKDNDLSFTIGNQLRALGYFSMAFHNNSYTYYDRDETHCVIGYDKFMGVRNGMEDYLEKNRWPNSDLEMFNTTPSIYLDQQPFSVYYMTVSGHSLYNWKGNSMCAKNKELVAHLEGSETYKAYMACQLELEFGLASLVKQLEDAGIADDTVIVLGTDHMPYGLEQEGEQYVTELYGYEADTFWKRDHSALIMWSGCLEKEEPIVVEDPVHSMDILPTLLNLFGIEFDSRLYIGRDVFSDAMPIAMWTNNLSWVTDKGYYNASTKKFTPREGVTDIPEDYVKNVRAYVSNCKTYSKNVSSSDYFAKLPDIVR